MITNKLSNQISPKIKAKSQMRRMPEIPQQYKKVASGMETQFINHMFQEMRKTIKKEKEDSAAVKLYQSLMDYESAKVMANKEEGLGIKELILRQIYPHYDEYKKAVLGQEKNILNNNNNVDIKNAVKEYGKIGDQL